MSMKGVVLVLGERREVVASDFRGSIAVILTNKSDRVVET